MFSPWRIPTMESDSFQKSLKTVHDKVPNNRLLETFFFRIELSLSYAVMKYCKRDGSYCRSVSFMCFSNNNVCREPAPSVYPLYSNRKVLICDAGVVYLQEVETSDLSILSHNLPYQLTKWVTDSLHFKCQSSICVCL